MNASGYRHPRRIVAVILGVVLLTAAGLKWADAEPASVRALPLSASPIAHTALIEIEAIFGLWLLTGAALRWAWLATMFLFTSLAATSLYLGLNGVASCGCYGNIAPISPWYALGFDMVALAALVRFFPKDAFRVPPNIAALRTGLRFLCVIAVLLIAISAGATLIYGSPARALNRLRGETLVISPYWSCVGQVAATEGASFGVEASNCSNAPIVIVGGTSGCKCLETYDLPIEVPPGAAASIRLHISPSHYGPFDMWFRLLTGDGDVASGRVSGIAE